MRKFDLFSIEYCQFNNGPGKIDDETYIYASFNAFSAYVRSCSKRACAA